MKWLFMVALAGLVYEIVRWRRAASRADKLENFIVLLGKVLPGLPHGQLQDTEAAEDRARLLMNAAEIQDILDGTSFSIIQVLPPPILAGRMERVSFPIARSLGNPSFHDLVTQDAILNAYASALGELLLFAEKAFRHVVNPFAWFIDCILVLAGVPFLLMKAAGFNADRAERSVVGKLFKLAVATCATALTILGGLDSLESLGVIPAGSFMRFITRLR